MYQVYPEAQPSRLGTIPMRVNRPSLAAIEGHNWELEGVGHTYMYLRNYKYIVPMREGCNCLSQ